MKTLEIATTSGDGHLYAESAVYATAHIAAEGTVQYGLNNLVIGQRYVEPGPPNAYRIWRAVLPFNAYLSLPAGAVITAATISIYGKIDSSDTDFDIVVVDGSDTHQPLQTADYGALRDDTVAVSDSLNTAAFSTSSYNVLTLTRAGIDLISAVAPTYFALRSSREIDITTPTGLEWVSIHDAVSGNGAKLIITYDSARVSSIRHIFGPGINRMLVGLGGVGLDIDVAEAAIRKIVAAELEQEPPEELVCPYCGMVFTGPLAAAALWSHVQFTHLGGIPGGGAYAPGG